MLLLDDIREAAGHQTAALLLLQVLQVPLQTVVRRGLGLQVRVDLAHLLRDDVGDVAQRLLDRVLCDVPLEPGQIRGQIVCKEMRGSFNGNSRTGKSSAYLSSNNDKRKKINKADCGAVCCVCGWSMSRRLSLSSQVSVAGAGTLSNHSFSLSFITTTPEANLTREEVEEQTGWRVVGDKTFK